MRKRVLRNKMMVVDGQRYFASVTATYGDAVNLRVTIRADFGTRSFVAITGLRNFDYFHHYGHWLNESYSVGADTIEITPRMLAALIRYASSNGWKPASEKPNRQIELTNLDAKSLFAAYNNANREVASTSTRSR